MDDTTISTADAAVFSNDKPAAEPAPTVTTLRIHVTPERMEGMKVRVWAKAEDTRKTIDTLQVLKRFVVGPTGHYLPDEEALELLNEATMGELNAALTKLMELAQEAAVPNE
jgi:anion-transporting  ArsA/GET3 family ATPase